MHALQGNCDEEVPADTDTAVSLPPLKPLVGHQCVITVDMPLLHTATQSARSMWLDGLYLRFQPTPRTYRFNYGLLFVKWGSTSLWMTDVRLQGSGPSPDGAESCANCGLFQWGDVHMERAVSHPAPSARVMYTMLHLAVAE